MRKILYALYCDCCGLLIRKEAFTAAHNHYAPQFATDPHPMWDLCVTCRPDIDHLLEKKVDELRARRKPKPRTA